jgi:hypothetical protein
MEIYGALKLRDDHSVHPQFVGVDYQGKPVIDFNGQDLPPPINPLDIIGFCQCDMGYNVHLYLVMEDGSEFVFDTLEEIRDIFA